MEENSYNIDNNNANDNAAPTGQVIERIKHTDDEGNSTLQYVTKPGCQHPNLTSKPADEFDGYNEVSCNECHLGWFVKVSS